MLIAQAKRKENVIEYILYMWQIEDIIRSFDFDLERIQSTIIDKYDQPKDIKAKIRLWYGNLIEMMLKQGIHDSGHLEMLDKLEHNLHHFHHSLITAIQPEQYLKAYNDSLPHLQALSLKSKREDQSEIRMGLNALYGMLILKLKKQEISSETHTAVAIIGRWLGYLAAYFRKFEAGELNIPNVKKN